MAVIALWLRHESLETTHVYIEADLATKERALDKLAPMRLCCTDGACKRGDANFAWVYAIRT